MTITKGIVSMISFSAPVEFIYRRATDFLFVCFCFCFSFEVILYPDTLLKLFISYRSFLVELLGLFIYTIMSYAKRNSLASSFPICIPLMSFGGLIPLAGTSNTTLNIHGENVHPWLVPYFDKINLNLCSVNLMLTIGLF